MNLNFILSAVGTLFPIVFPKQEFKPNRLLGVVVAVVLVIGSIKLIGVENTEQAIELTDDIIEMSEE